MQATRNVIVTLVVLIAAVACGRSARDPVIISDPWANATPGAATVAAVYMQITAMETDTLLSASTSVADRVEMHTSIEENGMMRMRPLPNVPLQAGDPFTFAPGGAHFMLMGLQRPLPAGLSFPMTLKFQKAGTRTVQVSVIEPGSR